MEEFFDFFSSNAEGIFGFIAALAIVMLIVQWIMWLTQSGRFKAVASESRGDLSDNRILYVVVDFFVKIINDFKHLLALIIVLIFAWVLIYSVVHAVSYDVSMPEQNFSQLKDVMQAVVASLGGIVGSIIGYYFGESAAKNKDSQVVATIPELDQKSGSGDETSTDDDGDEKIEKPQI